MLEGYWHSAATLNYLRTLQVRMGVVWVVWVVRVWVAGVGVGGGSGVEMRVRCGCDAIA